MCCWTFSGVSAALSFRRCPPAIVWHDAHWCGGPSAGIGDECPLLGEIAALAPAWERLYVLVDDARYFLAPPPAEHDAAQWPSLAQVVSAVNTGEGRFVASFEDVLVSLPPAARDLTLDYICQGRRPSLRRAAAFFDANSGKNHSCKGIAGEFARVCRRGTSHGKCHFSPSNQPSGTASEH